MNLTTTNLTKKQQLLLVATLILVLLIAWQVYELFFASASKPAVGVPMQQATVTQMPTASSGARVITNPSVMTQAPQKRSSVKSSEENVVARMSKEQEIYMHLAAEYQTIQMQRMIAEGQAAIATARLNAAKALAEMNKYGAEGLGANLSGISGRSGEYELIYLGEQGGEWIATLKKGRQTFDVFSGTILGNGVHVVQISQEGVRLKKRKGESLVSFNGEIKLDSGSKSKKQLQSEEKKRTIKLKQPTAKLSTDNDIGKEEAPAPTPKQPPVVKPTTPTTLTPPAPKPTNLTPASPPAAAPPKPAAPVAAAAPAATNKPPATTLPAAASNSTTAAPLTIEVKKSLKANTDSQDLKQLQVLASPNASTTKAPAAADSNASNSGGSANVPQRITITASPTAAIPLAKKDSKDIPKSSSQNSDSANAVLASSPAGEKQLMAASPKHYTIQLMANSEPASLTQFVKQHELGDKAAWYRTRRDGNDWYVLVYGQYSDMAQAKKALEALPQEMQSWAPFIRQLSSVQAAIKLAK